MATMVLTFLFRRGYQRPPGLLRALPLQKKENT